jgi:phosphopantothenate-cysteine ligase
MLLMVDFVTLRDYLFLLRGVSRIMGTLENKAMYYLAAAVSDFHVPKQKLVRLSVSSALARETVRLHFT